MADDREVLRILWDGRIPVCFTLNADEVVALEEPEPFYVSLIVNILCGPALIAKSVITEYSDRASSMFNIPCMAFPKRKLKISCQVPNYALLLEKVIYYNIVQPVEKKSKLRLAKKCYICRPK
jgi:hypothetical protein